MNQKDRLRWVRTVRGLESEDAAAQLLEAFERHVRDEEDEANASLELDEFEQLPDHEFSTLMAWAMQAPEPANFSGRLGASDLVSLREARLLGDLARAAEQSVAISDSGTTRRLAAAIGTVWMRIRGEAMLALALSSDEAEA